MDRIETTAPSPTMTLPKKQRVAAAAEILVRELRGPVPAAQTASAAPLIADSPRLIEIYLRRYIGYDSPAVDAELLAAELRYGLGYDVTFRCSGGRCLLKWVRTHAPEAETALVASGRLTHDPAC